MNNTITINIPKSVKSELTQLRADNAALRAEVARLALLDNLARDAIAVAKRERDLSIRKYFEANEELFALRARLAAADDVMDFCQHETTCEKWRLVSDKCTCGLDAALSAYRASAQTSKYEFEIESVARPTPLPAAQPGGDAGGESE